jgi:hypothetical protein
MDVSFGNSFEHARRHLARLVPRIVAAGSLALLGLGAGAAAMPVHAAPGTTNVYILGSSVSGGLASQEATEVAALGLTPIIESDAGWAALTASDFAASRGIVIGDPTCTTSPAFDAAAEANQAVWGPQMTGNIIVIGTDPVFHSFSRPGAHTLIVKGIDFTFSDATNPGAYVDQSCEAEFSPGPQTVLASFGVFNAVAAGCDDNVHIVANHPALTGLTDADLNGWSCSVHNFYSSWPASFLPLVIDENAPPTFTAADGTKGSPYILARGAGLVPCTDPTTCGTGGTGGTTGGTGATPELDSILLFGAGAAGLAGYARMRILAGRRKEED